MNGRPADGVDCRDPNNTLALSSLGHTWILDLDGTILKHNGYILDGHDTLLPGAREFLSRIPDGDMVVFITSRTPDQKDATGKFLARHNIRCDHIIYGAPYGERVLINDRKPPRGISPASLDTAIAVNVTRDRGVESIDIQIDANL